jgi:site-specific recombinase XerD
LTYLVATMAAIMEKPAPKDLSYHYSRVTKNRAASKMKQFYKYFSIPGIGNLAGGM